MKYGAFKNHLLEFNDKMQRQGRSKVKYYTARTWVYEGKKPGKKNAQKGQEFLDSWREFEKIHQHTEFGKGETCGLYNMSI